jgi:hypothetical protein
MLNDIVKKLHYNTMYTFRSCCAANFKVFNSLLYTISSTNTFPYFKAIFEEGYKITDTGFSILSTTNTCVVLKDSTSTNKNYLLIGDKNKFIILKSELTTFTYAYSASKISSSYGDLEFKNIAKICSYGDNNIYIIDSDYKNIYYFDGSSLVEEENIYNGDIVLRNVIGGEGTVQEKNKFGSLDNIAVNSNIIVAQDYINKCFKVYDRNLNWLGTTVFFKIFNEVNTFTAIILDDKNNLYCGIGSKIYRFIFKENNSFEFDRVSDVSTYFSNREIILDFKNCFSDKNIFYILTDKSVKKVWFTDIEYVIGSFGENFNVDMKWLGVGPYSLEKDLVVVYSQQSNNKEFFNASIDDVFIDTLLSDINFTIYSLEDLLFDKKEYIQSWSLLKTLKKIYYNNLILLKNIKYRYFQDKINKKTITEKIYNRGFINFSVDLDFDPDLNIGINEIFQADVINRCINSITSLQNVILLYMVNNKTNEEFLSPDPYRNNPSIKTYTYYVDDSLILIPSPNKLELFEEFSPTGGLSVSLGGAPYKGVNGISIVDGISI